MAKIEEAGRRARTSEETIAMAVNWGQEMFWKQHKKEILDNLAEVIVKSEINARKKYDEILDKRDAVRYPVNSVNPNFVGGDN